MILIDKAVVVMEIEDKIKKYTLSGEESDFLQDGNAKYWGGVLSCLNEIHSYLNSLEVKEVDLDREIRRYRMRNPIIQHREESLYDYMANAAKHFFKLGIKAQKGGEK